MATSVNQQSINEAAQILKNKGYTVQPKPERRPQARPYTHGSYIREQLSQLDLERLADRSYPWPEHINPAFMVKELEHALVELHIERYG